jgi:hypothetical protein
MNCPTCGRPAPTVDRFCGSCGVELRPPGAVPMAAVATASGRSAQAGGHPAVAGWSPAPAPPPGRRRLGPGLLAAVMGVLLLFGAVGLFAARTVTARAGAGSPEAAASGLLGALDRKDTARAAGYLHGEERQLLDLYGDRLTAAVAKWQGAAAGADLTARDVRFRQVAGDGDVAVLEVTGGTVGVTQPGGAKLELPVEEARRRLAEQTHGSVAFPRVVALRADGRWYVSLLASAAEWARLSNRSGPVDYARLAEVPAGQGASSPEAAVRGLADALGAGTVTAIGERLLPEERRVVEVYSQSLLAKAGASPDALLGGHPGARVEVKGLTLRSEAVADGVVKVHPTGGTVSSGAPGEKPTPLSPSGSGSDRPAPSVVVLRHDSAWYPSLLFSAVDAMLAEAERGRP